MDPGTSWSPGSGTEPRSVRPSGTPQGHRRAAPRFGLILVCAAAGCSDPQDSAHPLPDDSAPIEETAADTDTDADADTDTDVDLEATIREIQDGSVAAGTRVRVAGVVVVGGHIPLGFHVADPDGGTSYAGLWIHASPERVGVTVSEGLEVTLHGITAEYAASRKDGTLTQLEADVVTVTGEAEVPAPQTVDVARLADPDAAEPYEGMLLQVQSPEVTKGGKGEWRIDGGVLVDDLYVSTTTVTGATLFALRGLLYWTGAEFALEPRSSDDLQDYSEPPWDCRADLCAWDLVPGDLVVSEVMRNPESVPDDVGEWFEISSALEVPVDLVGLEVTDADGYPAFAIRESLVLAPEEHAVLGPDPFPWENGGVSLDAAYGYSECALANGADTLVLGFGDTVVDEVAWDDGGAFPALDGASMSLDPEAMDAALNDDGHRWCAAVSPYGDGDLGTPGAPNDPCSP
ncbi:MAG: lamin tail domain-containing protein [Deltaproteobacteria bacterium]|nr:lamin tail domain-containing protein [Deltaproteobacteria bacterium]